MIPENIGIFWFYNDKDGFRLDLVDGCAVSDGFVSENGLVSFPKAHKDVWAEKKRVETDGVFDSVPRGRVFYNKIITMYEVHTGFDKIPVKLLKLVKSRFHLPENTVGVYEEMYDQSACCMDAPQIGIFWFYKEDGKYKLLYPEGCPLREGEELGAWINYPKTHMKVWDSIPEADRKEGDFDMTRRGRVYYRVPSKRYEVHTGFRDAPNDFMSVVNNNFHLPIDNVEYVYDEQYDWGSN